MANTTNFSRNLITVGATRSGKTRALEMLVADLSASGVRAVVVDPRGDIYKKAGGSLIELAGKTNEEIAGSIAGWDGAGVLCITNCGSGHWDAQRFAFALDEAMARWENEGAAFVVDEWMPELAPVLEKRVAGTVGNGKSSLAVAMHCTSFAQQLNQPWLFSALENSDVLALGVKTADAAHYLSKFRAVGLERKITADMWLSLPTGHGFHFGSRQSPVPFSF